jgi:DNA modification methylase
MRKEVIGNAELYLGDCRDILPLLPKVDAVITDPPYGIGADKSMAKASGFQGGGMMAPKRVYEASGWDDEPISDALIEQVRSAGKWAVIFGGNYYQCPPTSCWLVWDKEVNGNFADCELAWTNLPKAVRRIRYMWNGMLLANGEKRGDHPTQKPIGVMEWVINHVPDPNRMVLDPFMGSGTTGVACMNLSRQFIGIEREPKYFDIACRRIEDAQRQGRLIG